MKKKKPRKKKEPKILDMERFLCREMIKDLRKNGFRALVGGFHNTRLEVPVDPHIKIITEGYPDLNIRIDIISRELRIAANGKNIYKISIDEPTSISGISDTIRILYDRFSTNNHESHPDSIPEHDNKL